MSRVNASIMDIFKKNNNSSISTFARILTRSQTEADVERKPRLPPSATVAYDYRGNYTGTVKLLGCIISFWMELVFSLTKYASVILLLFLCPTTTATDSSWFSSARLFFFLNMAYFQLGSLSVWLYIFNSHPVVCSEEDVPQEEAGWEQEQQQDSERGDGGHGRKGSAKQTTSCGELCQQCRYGFSSAEAENRGHMSCTGVEGAGGGGRLHKHTGEKNTHWLFSTNMWNTDQINNNYNNINNTFYL